MADSGGKDGEYAQGSRNIGQSDVVIIKERTRSTSDDVMLHACISRIQDAAMLLPRHVAPSS